MFLRGTV